MSESLFDYKLRVSPQARNIRLRVTAQGGLQVVVPEGYDTTRVHDLLERKKAWIREALGRAEAQRKFFQPEPAWRIPRHMKLSAAGTYWDVTVRPARTVSVTVRRVLPCQIEVSGRIGDEKATKAALSRWLAREAREALLPQLQAASKFTGLRFARAYIKQQRTRWASCSRHRAISLNARLMFLPPRLVRYVLIHELCHTVEMNHSRDFWRMVTEHCPRYRELDAELRDAWKLVPRWAWGAGERRALGY